MIVKVWYRRNLKLSPAKLAAQVAHAVNGLMITTTDLNIHVLMASDNKFEQIKSETYTLYYLQIDKGLTEIPANTETCLAYVDYE